MTFEHTFVFKTQKEAKDAYRLLEVAKDSEDSIVVGWWYGLKNFIERVRTDDWQKLHIIWLDDKYKVEIKQPLIES